MFCLHYRCLETRPDIGLSATARNDGHCVKDYAEERDCTPGRCRFDETGADHRSMYAIFDVGHLEICGVPQVASPAHTIGMARCTSCNGNPHGSRNIANVSSRNWCTSATTVAPAAQSRAVSAGTSSDTNAKCS